MDKLMLALVAFSSGVANLGKVMDSSESRCIANSVPMRIQTNDHVDYQRGQNGGLSYSLNRTTGCMVHPPADYIITTGIGAHKLHMRRRDWNEARKSCLSEGGQLAIINSVGEATILVKAMKKEKITELWIGTHDLFKDGDWVTLTGETLEAAGFDQWLPGEPNNQGGHENCGVLSQSDNKEGMNDIECKLLRPYFCKIYLC